MPPHNPTLEQLMILNANMGHGAESEFIRRRREDIARTKAENDDAYNRHRAELYNLGQQQRSDRDRAVKDFTRVCEQTGLIDKLRKE